MWVEALACVPANRKYENKLRERERERERELRKTKINKTSAFTNLDRVQPGGKKNQKGKKDQNPSTE